MPLVDAAVVFLPFVVVDLALVVGGEVEAEAEVEEEVVVEDLKPFLIFLYC